MKQYKVIILTTGNISSGEAELNKYAIEGWEILNMSTMDQKGWIIYTLVRHFFEKKVPV